MKNTKVVILAGGRGSRLSEETLDIPKPLVKIGDKPILWHIMKTYSYYGFNDFIICLGYKGYLIKEYFYHYYLHNSNVTLDLTRNEKTYFGSTVDPWRVTLIDTGLKTNTGGRIKKIEPYIDTPNFMLTYGDGVGNVDIPSLYDFHQSHNKIATLTACKPSGRFGLMQLSENSAVQNFQEKAEAKNGWINGGFFVLDKRACSYITDDPSCSWEYDSLDFLTKTNELMAYQHTGFWKPMDTLRDKIELNRLVKTNQAPWMVWDESQKQSITPLDEALLYEPLQ